MKRLPLALTFGCTAAMALLTSPDIAAGSTIANTYVLNGFGCKGQNVSPALVWSNPPAGTKSFAVQVYDPDAPTGSGFWHWTVYNIPASVTSLKQGAGNSPAGLPAGANGGHSDFFDTGATGVNGNWGGPCPPVGDKPHRYIFTVYALKTEKLDLPADATAALVGFMIHANQLGKASFQARYGRK